MLSVFFFHCVDIYADVEKDIIDKPYDELA